MTYTFKSRASRRAGRLAGCFVGGAFPVICHITPPIVASCQDVFGGLFIRTFKRARGRTGRAVGQVFELMGPGTGIERVVSCVGRVITLGRR